MMRRARIREATAQTATANLTRLLCIAVACAAGIFGLLSIGSLLAQAWPPYPAAAVAAWVIAFGLPVSLGLGGRWATPGLLRGIVTAEAVWFVLVTVFWLVMRPEPLTAGTGVPWAITFTGVPCVAVAVFARPRVAWGFTVLCSVLSGAVRFSTSADAHPHLVGLADGLYSFLLVSVFVAFTLAARKASTRVDDATVRTRQAEARRAARVSRRQERLRIDALVHDSVISTLLMAGLGRTPPAVVSEHASKTLSQLDAFKSPPVEPVILVSDVVRRVRQLAGQIAPAADVEFAAPSDSAFVERTVPSAAVAAILGAVGEALRNSVTSGGGGARGPGARRVRRSVHIVSTPDGFEVTISDDGVGFEPALVPLERLGIAQSIVGRMERVPHGVANVRSRPGHGTDIVVAWVPERGQCPARRGPHRDRRVAQRMLEPDSADAIEAMSLTRSLDLSTPLATAILVLFQVVHAVIAAIDIVPGRPLVVMLLAYLAIMGAAVALIRPSQVGLSHLRTTVVLGLCALGAVLMFSYIPAESSAPFAHWHLGAITLILVVLAARGQIRAAWTGYAILALLAVAWAVATGQPAVAGVELVIRHAGTLLAGTLFVLGFTRTEGALRVLTQLEITKASREATTVAVIDEREAELARVNLLARPTLHRLADPHALSDAERADCLLVEASLRDAIRGRSLFVEPVITAVRSARLRGVEVTVIDDSADSPPAELGVLAHTVAAEVDAVPTGRITVRVLPADRPIIATVVVDSGTSRMIVIGPHGTPVGV